MCAKAHNLVCEDVHTFFMRDNRSQQGCNDLIRVIEAATGCRHARSDCNAATYIEVTRVSDLPRVVLIYRHPGQ